jgi:lipoyl-dependent peroxiredoxin
MSLEILYTAESTVVGGREGHVKSSDGIIDMKISMPKGLGGKGEIASNPEQLFSAAYATCFDGALNLVASMQKKRIKSQTTIKVSIGKNPEGGLDLAADIVSEIEGVDQATATELVNAAHQFCPYSRATRGNIDVTIKAIAK